MLERGDNHYWGVVLEAPDAHELADFYGRLLGWPVRKTGPGWATVGPNSGVGYLGFQRSDNYVRPVWPAADGQQQMMMHLDIEVATLAEAVAKAVEAGATVADFQPQATVRVMLDPAGHPFCLYVDTGPASGSAQ